MHHQHHQCNTKKDHSIIQLPKHKPGTNRKQRVECRSLPCKKSGLTDICLRPWVTHRTPHTKGNHPSQHHTVHRTRHRHLLSHLTRCRLATQWGPMASHNTPTCSSRKDPTRHLRFPANIHMRRTSGTVNTRLTEDQNRICDLQSTIVPSLANPVNNARVRC
jgi:hypothetical protein